MSASVAEVREYRYECANGHTWITAPTEHMRCCVCGTTTLQRLKPVDHYDEIARQLWLWNSEHGGTCYPYDRLIDVTKDDLRTLARRLAPFAFAPTDEAERLASGSER